MARSEIRKEYDRLRIRAVFSASPETLAHKKWKKMIVVEYLLLGKSVYSNKYRRLNIVKVGMYDKSSMIINLYWDKKVNPQNMYYGNDRRVLDDCYELARWMFKLDYTEGGMQGPNYSNFDVEWKTRW